MGIPGEVGTPRPPGALSAKKPERLAPSILDTVETTQDLRTTLDTVADMNRAQIEDARRGIQTTAQREDLARPIAAALATRMGQDPEKFMATMRQRGVALNAEQLEALRMVHDRTMAEFGQAADAALASDAPEDLLRAAKGLKLVTYLTTQKAGVAAEAGAVAGALAAGSTLAGAAGVAAVVAGVRAEVVLLARPTKPRYRPKLSRKSRTVRVVVSL
jgi:hypothetical protein